ncbi:RNA polymerase subunit sigma-70 [Sinorhizobium meliloti]|uniref:RNA polymerase subunit sigma-70 n=1 Tax=Rhizobium meliloti TaxID=382 RepID=UPI001F4499E0|nr:RNA polymerase subunit sigma-70 [Sinorhizobium meliloti]
MRRKRCFQRAFPSKQRYFSSAMEKVTRSKGRPAHEPAAITRRFVEAMAGAGVPQSEIASVLSVAVPTLRKHYRHELRRGAAVVETRLASRLMRIANGSDGTALKAIMFTLQCRFGWSRYAPPPRR